MSKNNRAQQKYDISKSIKVKIDSTLSFEDAFAFVVQFAEQNPDVIQKMGQILDKSSGKFPNSFGCPFPLSCSVFPCDSLGCSADECDNGFVFRRS